MNAHAQALETRDDSNPPARHLIAVALSAFLLFILTVSIAGAQPYTFKNDQSQNAFVNDCRFIGATPHREATHVVSCTTPSGQKTTCDFNQKPANCTVTPPPKTSAAANGNGGNMPSENTVQSDMNVASPSEASESDQVLVEDTQVANVSENGASVPLITAEQPVVETSPASDVEVEDDVDTTQVASTHAESFPMFEEDESQ